MSLMILNYRTKLIGKTVEVKVDYIKPANNGYPEKVLPMTVHNYIFEYTVIRE